jgi:hypothetical protein
MGKHAAVYGMYYVALSTALHLAAGCAIGDAADPQEGNLGTVEPHGINMQGINMQGINMQGINMQGMAMLGFNVDGATLGGAPLGNVRVERGELVAELAGATLRGTSLLGAHVYAQVRNITLSPPAIANVEYRITAITPEAAQYDPTHSGNTYLYSLEQWVADSATWQAACSADADGKSYAIPVAAIFDERGDRKDTSSMFTFGCTSGVIAKCYRWGYRPWLTGYGDVVSTHWSCTRMARADYCGDGTPHTRNGTAIDVWDRLPAPGPIQRRVLIPSLGMLFEAGWNTQGAVCLSRARWLQDSLYLLGDSCPNRVVSPGLVARLCDTVAEALGYDGTAQIFDAAYLNLDVLGLLGR